MRRAEIANRRTMEVQKKTFIESHLANSKFVQKVTGIPIVQAAVDQAQKTYAKVKGSHELVSKSIELAVHISSTVVEKLTPIAEKGMSIASPISSKVDDIACKGVDGFISLAPVINEEPKEIVERTRTAMEKPVTVINGYTEAILKTWAAQSCMDVYEAVLSTACTTLDAVLPPPKEEKSSEQNGLASKKDYPSEEDKHKRGLWLFHHTCLFFTTVYRRAFGTHVESATIAADNVYQQVKNAVGDVSNANNDANNAANNGDSNKPASKKQGKNKNKQQE